MKMRRLAIGVTAVLCAALAAALLVLVLAHRGKSYPERVLRRLNHPNWKVRASAAESLGDIGTARAVEPLIAALQDEQEWVRKAAAHSLGRIHDAGAAEPLSGALKDESPYVRASAAEALGWIGHEGGVPALTEALNDEKEWVREAAEEALENIRRRTAIRQQAPTQQAG